MIFTVAMWRSDVANSKTEKHLTNTASDVSTAIECEGYFIVILR